MNNKYKSQNGNLRGKTGKLAGNQNKLFEKIKHVPHINISLIIKHLCRNITTQNQKKPVIFTTVTGFILLFIMTISCEKIFSKILIYEKNETI